MSISILMTFPEICAAAFIFVWESPSWLMYRVAWCCLLHVLICSLRSERSSIFFGAYRLPLPLNASWKYLLPPPMMSYVPTTIMLVISCLAVELSLWRLAFLLLCLRWFVPCPFSHCNSLTLFMASSAVANSTANLKASQCSVRSCFRMLASLMPSTNWYQRLVSI